MYMTETLKFHTEASKTNPINNYGKTKLYGDIACQKKILHQLF